MSWGGGGVVSTTCDQLRFLHTLVQGKLVSQESLLQMKSFLPMGFGIQYGLGLMRFSNPIMPARFQIWGHSGSIGSFLYYNEAHDMYYAGTFSKVNGVIRPIVEIMKDLFRQKA